MATLTFFKYDRVIQVDSPVEGTEVSVQQLVNEIRDYEDELDFLDYGHICNATGKQDLGGGTQVGITLELINDWRIQFESPGSSPTITVYIRGGNLVATNSYNNNPIKPSDYVTVIIAQSSSPTIITPPEDVNMLHLVESLRGRHSSLGDIWYWDPINGSDTNDGTQPGDAVKTFAQAQTLAADGNNDIIFALAKDASGVTTSTEVLNITKDSLKVRGPGYSFQLAPTTPGSPTITVSANNVEVSGFYVTTDSGGTDDGISVSGSNNLIKDCWIKDATGNGISLSSASRTIIEKCAVEDPQANGIDLGNTTTQSTVTTSIVSGAFNGVELSGTGIADNIFENNLIYNNSSYGIDIGSGVTRTGVRLHHTFSGNTSGNTRDLGSATFIETPAGGASASDIADAVWDEIITDHSTTGTTGKALRDAKTKATLASLK